MATYTERQNDSGFKVGDRVRITRAPGGYEDGWGCGPISNPDRYVGATGEIYEKHNTYGFAVKSIKNGERVLDSSYWPFFVLEHERKDPAKVINDKGNTVIIIDGKATLIGHFTKAELERVLPELY